MRKDDKSVSAAQETKPADKNKKFSFNRYLAEMDAQKIAEEKYRDYVPEGAIKASFDKRPNPDMLFDYNIGLWVPKSVFRTRQELIDKEIKCIVDSMPDPDNPGYTFGGDKIKTGNPAQKIETAKQQLQQETGTPVAPKESSAREKKPKAKPKVKSQPPKSQKADSPPPVETDSKLKPIATSVQTESISEPQPEDVEQSRKTRRSAKMVESDFDSLATQFICPTELLEKKPLFFPEKIRESLRKIAGLVPGGKVSPSHIAIHVIEAWVDEHRELFNRMFANQKTSI